MLDLLTAATGLLLLAVVAVLVPATLRIRGVAAFVVAALVAAAAEIVLLTIGLSLVYGLQPGWMLLGQLVGALGAVSAWIAAGRPLPGLPRPPSRAELRGLARDHPAAAGALACAIGASAVTGLLAVAVAPSNWDSMTYHLGRVAFWLQYDSALHYDNGTIRQLASGVNGEFLQAWTILVTGTDRFAALVQWLALGGLGAAIFVAARLLGARRPAALFAAALFAILPQPVLQASTTQNDLIVSFFVVATGVFGVRGIRDRDGGDLAIGALALGLAVGTKGTALVALPALAVVLGAALMAYRPPRALVLRGAALAAASLALLGAFNYVLNQEREGNPLGGVREQTDRESPLFKNTVRIAWTFAESPGANLPWLDTTLVRAAQELFGDLRNSAFTGFKVETVVHEDSSAFGLVGLVLFFPLLLVALAAPRSPPAHRVLAAASLLYFAVFVVGNEYNMWMGRVLLPGVAIGAPLMVALHGRGMLRGAALALALLGLVPSLFSSETKPLAVPRGQPNILSLDRTQQQTFPRREMASVLSELRRAAEPEDPLGLVRGEDSWDYPFFGRQRVRRIVPLSPAQATHDTMRREGLRGIVFANVNPPEGLPVRPLAQGYWFALPPP